MINKSFILAGKAVFTLDIPADAVVEKPHYTFKVVRKDPSGKWPESFFVYLLSGPDNTRDYTYVGKLQPFDGRVELTRASKINADSYVMILLNRLMFRIWRNECEAFEQLGYKLHHEGKCGRCGRALTVPESIESGIGPECAKMVGA